MRGDAALTARLLLRPAGLAGVLVAVGGATAVLATTRPWYETVADLEMLGRTDGRVVASLTGVPETAPGWATLVLGVAAVVLGISVALDRPAPWTVPALAGIAAALALTALWAALTGPTLGAVVADEASSLLALRDGLPTGVTLELTVRRGVGPWFVVMAAVAVGIGALGARDG